MAEIFRMVGFASERDRAEPRGVGFEYESFDANFCDSLAEIIRFFIGDWPVDAKECVEFDCKFGVVLIPGETVEQIGLNWSGFEEIKELGIGFTAMEHNGEIELLGEIEVVVEARELLSGR